MATALRLSTHPPQAAAGRQTLHRELHGGAHREMDQLPHAGESGTVLLSEYLNSSLEKCFVSL